MLLINNVDAYHTCTILRHFIRLCRIYPLCSLHKGYIGSIVIFLFIRLSLAGSALLHVFNINSLIFKVYSADIVFPKGNFYYQDYFDFHYMFVYYSYYYFHYCFHLFSRHYLHYLFLIPSNTMVFFSLL